MILRNISALSAIALLFGGTTCSAQITGPKSDQAPPIAGAGHDYIGFLNETVVPSTGAVSVRINVPMPPARGLTIPFAFGYDSNSAEHFVSGLGLTDNFGYVSRGGWSYVVPMMSAIAASYSVSANQVVNVSETIDPLNIVSGLVAEYNNDNGNVCPDIWCDPPLVIPQTGVQPQACPYMDHFNFADLGGGVHDLGLQTQVNAQVCTSAGGAPQTVMETRIDPRFVGNAFYTGNPAPGVGGEVPSLTVVDSGGTAYSFTNNPVHQTVADSPFNPNATPSLTPQIAGFDFFSLPSSIEDRNGNITTIADNKGGSFQYTDSLGRTSLSTSGFGVTGTTVSVAGLANPYTLTWGTAPINWLSQANIQVLSPVIPGVTVFCKPGTYLATRLISPANPANPFPVVTQILLPNGQSYQFQYDQTYGLISKLIYPEGGYVRYVWGLSRQASEYLVQGLVQSGTFTPVLSDLPCEVIFDLPAVASRFMSFDGKTEVLEQDFTYTTTWAPANSGLETWSSKQTKVVTKDLVAGTSFTTTYNYVQAPTGSLASPLEQAAGIVPSSPVEQTVQTVDASSHLLSTVSKSYNSALQPPQIETTTLDNGLVSQVQSCFNDIGAFSGSPCPTPTVPVPAVVSALGANLTDRFEYDFGQNAPGPLMRHTHTDYNTITNPFLPFNSNANLFPQSPYLAEPIDTIVYDGSGNRIAETDYGYDQTAVSQATAFGHDETNYGSSSSVHRGNATTVTKQCFNAPSGMSCPNSVTTFAYDETGQMLSAKDTLGNVASYSYTDSFTGSTPPSSTNAYLTKITYPATANGSINHAEHFSYAYSDGQLTQSTDENGQLTTYAYNDPLRRLTQINYPAQVVNGTGMIGSTTVTYNDAPGSISVQRTQQQDGTNVATDLKLFDNVGHLTGTELLDPEGNVLTATSYDGLGRVLTATNPYRTTTDTTYGVTTTQYDALSRITGVTHPDGSSISTSYTGRAIEVQDEGNGTARITRISQVDGLGRLTSVCEVTAATQAGGGVPSACGQDIAGTGFLTTYQYDTLSNLTGVRQGGVSRWFAYDSLSRLRNATNPESGTTSYNYDGNGNLISRIRPAANQPNPAVTVTASYQYDQLSRLISTIYSDSVTPSISRHYDTALELGVGLDNTIGRLSAEYVTSPGGQLLSGRVYSYDPMGRVIDDSQCLPQDCGSGTAFSLTYGYDLLGHQLSSTNGQGVVFNSTYDSAGHLTTMTSSLSDSNHPGTLFSGAAYNALDALTGASVGSILNEALAYDCRGRVVSYGSAVFPATATAPSVTNSGCPVATAMAVRQTRASELFSAYVHSSLPLQYFFRANSGLWASPGVRIDNFQRIAGLAAPPPPRLVGSRSSSVLLSRTGLTGKRDHGAVTITVTPQESREAPVVVRVDYGPRDNSKTVTERLARRFNERHASWVSAKTTRSDSGIGLELTSRIQTFVVSASVRSNHASSSLRATVVNMKKGPPNLLTNLQGRGEVRR